MKPGNRILRQGHPDPIEMTAPGAARVCGVHSGQHCREQGKPGNSWPGEEVSLRRIRRAGGGGGNSGFRGERERKAGMLEEGVG